jgi:hypothetical protein
MIGDFLYVVGLQSRLYRFGAIEINLLLQPKCSEHYIYIKLALLQYSITLTTHVVGQIAADARR